jgi:hypothetical protein
MNFMVWMLRSQNKFKQVMSNTDFKLIYISVTMHLMLEIMSCHGLDLKCILLKPIKN